MALDFPDIDPVAFSIGPMTVHWYALAYIAGFVAGWAGAMRIAKRSDSDLTPSVMDDVFVWCMLGVILGGRIGYTLFYQPMYFLSNPGDIFAVWQGGMSFHGGLIGLLSAVGIFASRRGISFFAITDIIAAVVPIGIFFGRIANFINGELYGQATDLPWGVIFPGGGPIARHPSQLYEAGLEGLLLFIVLMALIKLGYLAKTGILSGVFLIGYGVSRFAVEFVRLPDPQLGQVMFGLSMGQLLSFPMILAGAIILWWAAKQNRPTPVNG